MKKKTPWTPERTAEAVRLWVEGKKTGGEVARILGNTTRHAVINKLRSLNITRSSSGVTGNEAYAGFVMFEDLGPRHCRFPLWGFEDKPDFKYCGRRKKLGSPYCEEHNRIATRPFAIKKRFSAEDTRDKESV